MASKKDSFSSRVSLNLVANVLRTVLMALAGLLMVPYYIDQFGIATYAILPLATTVTNYFVMISDSLSNAFSRYISISAQNGDSDNVNVVFTSSVIGMAKCMLMMAPVAILVSLAAPYIFHIGPSGASDVQVMFLLIMAASMIISFGSSLGGVYTAFNSLYITYFCRSVQTASQVAVVVLLLIMDGPSLPLIGVSFLASALLMLVLMILPLRRICPTLQFRRGLHDAGLLKEMGSLGLWAMLSELGSLLFIQASLVIVNMMLGSGTQGVFSIAASMIMMVHTACTALAAVSIPLVYREYAVGDIGGLMRVLRIFTKFVGITMAFPIAYVIIFMPQVLGVWLGHDYQDLYGMLYIMLPIEVLICATSALADVPVVFARVKPLAVATLIIGVANIASASLIIQFTDAGALGVCVCWAASMVFLKLVFYPMFCHELTGGRISLYYRPIAEAYAVFAVCLVGLYALSLVFTPPMTWPGVIVPFILLFLLFFVLEMRFIFDSEERDMVKSYLPRFIQRVIDSMGARALRICRYGYLS